MCSLVALYGFAVAKKRKQRYKGPYLNQLAPDDFRREPVPWKAFLLGGSVWHVCNVPEHTDHLCERTEENLMTYLVRRPACVYTYMYHVCVHIAHICPQAAGKQPPRMMLRGYPGPTAEMMTAHLMCIPTYAFKCGCAGQLRAHGVPSGSSGAVSTF